VRRFSRLHEFVQEPISDSFSGVSEERLDSRMRGYMIHLNAGIPLLKKLFEETLAICVNSSII
jgi:hypothetical protein